MQVWPNKLQQCVYKITSASLYCAHKRHRKFKISSLTQVALVYVLVSRFPYERGAWSQALITKTGHVRLHFWSNTLGIDFERLHSALPGIHQVSAKSDTATVLLFCPMIILTELSLLWRRSPCLQCPKLHECCCQYGSERDLCNQIVHVTQALLHIFESMWAPLTAAECTMTHINRQILSLGFNNQQSCFQLSSTKYVVQVMNTTGHDCSSLHPSLCHKSMTECTAE